MKKIKQTLTASLLACTSLNSLHAEVAPLSYGIKAFFSLSSLRGIDSAVKIGGKSPAAPFMGKCWFAGMAQVEYAFTNYIGTELCLGYSSVGGKFSAQEKAEEGREPNKNPTFSTHTHGVTIPISLCVYPLGREEDGGTLKVFLGPDIYIPFSRKTCIAVAIKDSEDVTKEDSSSKEIGGLDVALRFGLSYDVLRGVSIEACYGMGFMNRLNLEKDKKATVFGDTVSGLDNMKTQYIHAGVGLNLASFFQS